MPLIEPTIDTDHCQGCGVFWTDLCDCLDCTIQCPGSEALYVALPPNCRLEEIVDERYLRVISPGGENVPLDRPIKLLSNREFWLISVLFFIIVRKGEREFVRLDLPSTSTILELKQHLNFDLPTSQTLWFQEEELRNEENTLANYGIMNGSVLCLNKT